MNLTLEISYVQELLSSVWPNWKITKILGKGSYGKVYEILRDDLGTGSGYRCALKVLQMEADDSGDAATMRLMTSRNIFDAHIPGESSQNDALEDFVRGVSAEIDAMMQLKGAPNIVTIEDYAILRSKEVCTILIRMEELVTLEQYLIQADGNLSREEVIRLGMDICNALSCCEQLGILHRDIKPSNIFYRERAGYKLGDFGISRTMDSIYESRSMSGIGTIQYMAPEVYFGHKYNNTVDIYSLGITLYTLLNGNIPPLCEANPLHSGRMPVPDRAEIHSANMRRLNGEMLPPPAGADQKLADAICKACSSDPSRRYQTAKQFHDALEECLIADKEAPGPGTDPTPDPPGSPHPPVPSRPALIAGITAAVIILLTAVFLILKPQTSVSYTVRCVDTEGAVLLEKESSEKAGQELSVSSPPIDGYIPQEEEKSFIVSRKEDNNLVIFVYDKESLPTTCTVLCKDTEGNILDSHTVDGLAGETFTASAPDLDEYILQEEEQDSCTLTLSEDADSNQIVFTYEKIYLTFNDPALEYAVRRSMNLTGSTRGISFAEAKSVGELNLSGALENNYGMIKDLTGLSAFTGLKKLDLGDNLVADVSELVNLTDLEWLCLEKNRIKDITPLKNLRKMTHLDLYLNNIEDASPAMRLTNLTMLDLRDNNISTVDGIKSLTKLKQLYLGKNHIRDISQLKELYDLDYLSLGDNEIEDISMLKNLQKIAVLAVPNNKIKDISVVTRFPLLYWLEVNGNPIADKTPLNKLPKNVKIKQ